MNDISEKDNLASIGNYLETRLENAMKGIIQLLKNKKASMAAEIAEESNINQERFVQLLDETKELLKLSSGIQKIKNANICRQETLS